MSQNLVNERDPRLVRAIVVGKATAPNQWRAKGSEIAGADDSTAHDRVVTTRAKRAAANPPAQRTTRDLKPRTERPTQEWPGIHNGGGAHFGKLMKAPKHFLIEPGHAGRIRVLLFRQPQLHRQ